MEIERKISDEGYNSEESGLSPVAKGLSRREIRRIALEAKIFKEKYQISKVMNNSANGVIYEVFCFKSVHEHINQTMKSDELVCTATEFFQYLKANKIFRI